MAAPKSVIKIKRDGVEFVSNVDRVNYTISELTRAALKEVGKLIAYRCAQKVSAIESLKGVPFNVRRIFGKGYQYWVRKKENDLQVGIHNVKYTNKYTWYGAKAELGLDGNPKRAFLYETVKENIENIRNIEAQYLSAIEDEQRALAMIDEAEEVGTGEN